MVTTLIILVISIVVLVLWYGAVPRRAGLASGTNQGVADTGAQPANGWFKLATYNIHGGKGSDGVRDLKRTAEVLAGAHIVALQEVRTGWFGDQTREIQDLLGLAGVFAPTQKRWFNDYRGNSLLSAYPIARWESFYLPSAGVRRYRIFTVAEVRLGERAISILFTHLHTRNGREQQLKIVLEHFARLPAPCALVGDLNSGQADAAFTELPGDAEDGIGLVLGAKDSPRVDWIITRGLEIRGGGCEDSTVSDHPYFWVEARIR